MVANYVKIALRRLIKEKEYVLTNVVGLTIGITACVLIGLYIRHELSYDTYHQDYERIFRIVEKSDKKLAKEVKSEVSEVENFATVNLSTGFLFITRNTRQYSNINLIAATPTLFEVLTHPLIHGSKKGLLDRPNTIVISLSMANRIFGKENPVGETLDVMFQKIEGNAVTTENVPMEVTGVIRDVPNNSHFLFDAIVPLASINPFYNNKLTHYLKISPRADPVVVEEKIDLVTASLYGKDQAAHTLQPLTDIYLGQHEAEQKGDPSYIYFFAAVAFLILIIAVINYINLSTARGGLRANEVGIRKASGAQRGDLFRQFMSESLISTLFVIPFILLLVVFLIPYFSQLMNVELNLNIFENFTLVTILILFVVGTGVVSGIYPAVILSSFMPVKVLKGTYSGTVGSSGLRRVLIVFQFVISCGLIMTTIVITNQMMFIQNKNLGFEKEQVLSIELTDDSNRPPAEVIRSRFLKNPNVISAALSSQELSSFVSLSGSARRLDSTENSARFGYNRIDPNFIPLMGMKVISGHNFRSKVTNEMSNGVIINNSGLQALGWEHPAEAIGNQVRVVDRTSRTIIGVVEDFHTSSLHDPIEPQALLAELENYPYYRQLNLKIQPGNLSEIIPSLRATWGDMVTGIPFDYQFLEERLRNLYAQEHRTYLLFLSFAIVAILLACMGLFGLATYACQRRTKEIGIRKVLGASTARILAVLSKDFTFLIMIGFFVATPLAFYFMHQWLQKFAYKIEIGFGIIFLTGFIVFSIALITVSWQSIKAAIVNPVDSLRSE